MEKILGNNTPPQDEAFVKIVKEQAIQVLQDKYLRQKESGGYDEGYPTNPMQYDWTEGAEKKITIPESIGLIESLIKQLNIPREDKQELCVTLLSKNPELVEDKLDTIKAILKKDDITLQEIQKPSTLHKLFNNSSEDQIDKLFKDVSGLDITDTWRDQQQFKLAKQLYVAATAYGDNSTACIQGTCSQIITTAEEIKSKLLDQYVEYAEKLKKEEEQRNEIIRDNVNPLVEQMLSEFAQDPNIINGKQELKQALIELTYGQIDVRNPFNVTKDQQQALAEVNKKFTQHIKEYIPGYYRPMPTYREYENIIDAIFSSEKSEGLANLLATPAIPQEIIRGFAEVQIVGDDQQSGPSHAKRARSKSPSLKPGHSR